MQSSPNPSAVPSPRIFTADFVSGREKAASRPSSAALSAVSGSLSTPSLSSESSLASREHPPTSAPREESLQPPVSSSVTTKPLSIRSIKSKAASVGDLSSFKKKQKSASQRWWRISDDKVKESKTSEVLSMQKEVYLLFYELDRRGDETA
ncbi:hypothetical protein GQ43DRAFT_373192 [Delitschia confertaspora ATCC 74209]|uniref:Uncharacterized protein n=1 Tax=Delitschia confertaspora ATCC 74209 TaxID=1513339 RepID=A0A9P4JKC3_9PLEO|nr:hypothetical protein GQ43DRAFT_373192 [Delitschia confertaspora ATCC 74209]